MRERIRKRPLAWVIGASLISLMLGIALGAGTSEETDLRDQVASLEEDLSASEEEAEASAAEAALLQARIDNAVGSAKRAERRAEQRREKLDRRADELAERSSKLDAREEEIEAAEQTLTSSTIPDGVWELGRDYEAGTYRAPGGSGCYWEKLSSPGGEIDDIIANGGFNKNQTLVIDSPYFSTEDCGEWVKIG